MKGKLASNRGPSRVAEAAQYVVTFRGSVYREQLESAAENERAAGLDYSEKKCATSASISASLSPTFGIIVPDRTFLGFFSHRRMFFLLLDKVLATIRLRLPMSLSVGPIVPFASGIPGMTWQAVQPLARITSSGSSSLA